MTTDNTIQFPISDRQVDRVVKAFRSSMAEGMASTGLSGERTRRALDALEPDIRMLAESLVVEPMPATVLDYQKAVLANAGEIFKQRLVAILEQQ